MAKVGDNIVTTGFSGKLGDLIVFRNRNGKTYVSKAPTSSGKASEAQLQHRKKFQKAVLYGKSIMANPEMKEAYESLAKDGKTAYNVAVADFLNAPSIEEIDVSNYTGNIGDTIRVLPVDDFMVTEVSVTINNEDGSEVEHGLAVQDDSNIYWVYTATANNESTAGDKITVIVSDLPGNTSEDQLNIE